MAASALRLAVTRSTDVAVIGAGPGGYPAAIRAAQLGKKVVLIERDRLGGECLNYGCIPSKALIRTANLVHEVERAADRGIKAGAVEIDMERVQAWKGSVVDRLVNGVALLCKGNGVDVVFGEASFSGPQSLLVRKPDGSSEEIVFEQAIIATGGRPSDLPGFRFDGNRVVSTKEALELDGIPHDLLVIGGGVSGLEIGTMYAKLGSRVVVVELLEQLLPGMDPEVVRVVARKLKNIGVEFHVKSQAKTWKDADGYALVDVETPEGPIPVRADVILVAVGRRPNTDGLNPGGANVALDGKGYIIVDRQMRTSNPHVYAIGDVVGPPFLAHKATKEGLVVAEVISGRSVEVDYRALPNAIFTDPEIATVGMQESQLQGRDVRIGKVPFAAIGRALTTGEAEGFVKLIADGPSKLLLGAQIVGPDASDLISELALAIEMGATVEDIALTIHPHPTLPEGIMESAEAALGQAIHVLNR